MATRFTSTLVPSNTTAAQFQAWAAFVESVITTGWVVTTDTGQTLPASLPLPTAINTKYGYRIYRMNDALQATAPVFIRIDFGSGAATSFPSMWITVGTGSDGAGNITGTVYGPNQLGLNNQSASQATNCYGSGDTNRFVFALFIYNVTSNAFNFIWGLERSKDTSGNDTSDGLIFIYADTQGGSASTYLRFSQYMIRAGGSQPAVESGISYVKTNQNPTFMYPPGEVNAAPIIPFKGVAQMPGMNFVITNANDVSAEGSFQMTLYGQLRTYQNIRCRVIRTGAATTVDPTLCMANIRYD